MTTLGKVRIRGIVSRAGAPVEGAYLTLNSGEDFIAERRTGPDGTYEFHTGGGTWTLNCRASGGAEKSQTVESDGGELTIDFELE